MIRPVALALSLLLLQIPGPVASFAEEEMPPTTKVTAVPSPTTPEPQQPPETVWLENDLPADAQAEGEWIWNDEQAAGGERSHSHPAAKGMAFHAVTFAQPIRLPTNGLITQEVWLDPKDPPQGIALKFKLATDQEAGVYWEGEKEVFTPDEYEELWYYGALPELGKWTKLEILVEDLGLEDQEIAGIRFITYDGHVLWDKTALTEAPPLEGEKGNEPALNLPAPTISIQKPDS